MMFIFLVSCAPPLTDAELEAELAKLTPEERAELLADLESKESGALAGQAINYAIKTKLSPRVAAAPVSQLKKAISKTSLTKEQIVEATAITPEGKAAQFCNKRGPHASGSEGKLVNLGEKTHYCSQSGDEIKYDRFHCVEKPSGGVAVHDIDTTYEKSLLYPEVDTCGEILAQFLDKPEVATIGCYDSDAGSDANNAGYIEFTTIQTGNKATSAPSGVVGKNKEKEVDACDPGFIHAAYEGPNFKGYEYIGYEGGYSGVVGYVEPVKPDWATSDNHLALFERKCPALFEDAEEAKYTKIVDCPYESGYRCQNGRCDSSIRSSPTLGGKPGCLPAGQENCKELWTRY